MHNGFCVPYRNPGKSNYSSLFLPTVLAYARCATMLIKRLLHYLHMLFQQLNLVPRSKNCFAEITLITAFVVFYSLTSFRAAVFHLQLLYFFLLWSNKEQIKHHVDYKQNGKFCFIIMLCIFALRFILNKNNNCNNGRS